MTSTTYLESIDMEYFNNFVKNFGVSFIADALVCLFALVFFITFLAKKHNYLVMIVGLVYVACFAVMAFFCAKTQGAIFYVGTTVFRYLTVFFIVAFCMVYQSDLKSLFASIRNKNDDAHYAAHGSSEDDLVVSTNEIIKATQVLSKNDIGALIVICGSTVPTNIVETGTRLDCLVSSAVLQSIFNTKSPLHDGAVIIRGARIVSAACVLTLSDNSSISRDLGTRHRAGLGVSENTDALVLIVSEETGIISMARGGKLTRHLDADSLRKILGELYHEEHSPLWRWTHRERPAKGGKAHDD